VAHGKNGAAMTIQIDRHRTVATQRANAIASPARLYLKPPMRTPGSPFRIDRRSVSANHRRLAIASPANSSMKPKADMPGSPFQIGRLINRDLQGNLATASPASRPLRPTLLMPGSPFPIASHFEGANPSMDAGESRGHNCRAIPIAGAPAHSIRIGRQTLCEIPSALATDEPGPFALDALEPYAGLTLSKIGRPSGR